MQSVRRAVLRSAASASAQVARTSSTSTAPLFRSVAAKAVRMPVNNLAIAARYFSQTARVANEEEKPAAVAEGAAAGGSGSGSFIPDPTPHGVFVRNIVFDASEANLREAFEHYGPVVQAAIARDARGISRGFGFVFFETQEAQAKALEEANGSFWHGRRIVVMPRTPRAPRTPTTQRAPVDIERDATNSLYIGNLPYETTDADLNVVFGNVEGLQAVRVAVDRATGWPRGFAHADFATTEQAKAGFEFLQNKEIGGRVLRVDFAQPSRRQREVGQPKADGEAEN